MCDTCNMLNGRPRERDTCLHCGRNIYRTVGTMHWYHSDNIYCGHWDERRNLPVEQWQKAEPKNGAAPTPERKVRFSFDERSSVPLATLQAHGVEFAEINVNDRTLIIPRKTTY